MPPPGGQPTICRVGEDPRHVDADHSATELVTVEGVFRDASGQAVASLVRIFGDITLAEDAVQDAFLVAEERWPGEGIPPNPAGWIITTARRRAIDVVRREARGRELHRQLSTEPAADAQDVEFWTEEKAVVDDKLRLIFTCCHPSLRPEHQIALTLRLLGGLTIDEIARSFLVGESATAKRLVRAKYKIKAANIPYRVPAEDDLPMRIRSVLSVLYLIYNAGADNADRAELRLEAIRLARLLAALMPDESEAAGLLALMLLNESRMPARTAGGETVLLRDQDRGKWDRELIAEGHDILRTCIRRGRPGPYQMQAAIQAVHCDARSFEATDWQQIVALYDRLLILMPTSVVALNRAIAVGESEGPAAALDLLDLVATDLDDYHLLHAARGSMLHVLGRTDDSLAAYEQALVRAPTETDRRSLQSQIDELTDGTGSV